MARLPNLDPATLDPDQRRVHDTILAGPRGIVEGPLSVWLVSAGLADRAQALGAYCRYGTSLPPRLSELAIITMGAWWQAGFEWHVHAPLAREAGIDPAAIEAIRRGEQPNFTAEDEAAVHVFARELLDSRRVSQSTYDRAVTALGQKGTVELVGILGYYGLISMTINAFEVEVPAGAPLPFA